MSSKKIIDQTVIPSKLWITETDGGITGKNAAHLKPLGYGVTLVVSPLIIDQLLGWSLRNGYHRLRGELTTPESGPLKRSIRRDTQEST